jgi:hypothetical protein
VRAAAEEADEEGEQSREGSMVGTASDVGRQAAVITERRLSSQVKPSQATPRHGDTIAATASVRARFVRGAKYKMSTVCPRAASGSIR